MTQKAFTAVTNIIYFVGAPLLTARDSNEARYRVAELNERLKKHLAEQAPRQDAKGWEATGTKFAGMPGKPRRYGFYWNAREDQDLIEGLKSGLTVSQLAGKHERDLSGITCRIDKLTGHVVKAKASQVDTARSWFTAATKTRRYSRAPGSYDLQDYGMADDDWGDDIPF